MSVYFLWLLLSSRTVGEGSRHKRGYKDLETVLTSDALPDANIDHGATAAHMRGAEDCHLRWPNGDGWLWVHPVCTAVGKLSASLFPTQILLLRLWDSNQQLLNDMLTFSNFCPTTQVSILSVCWLNMS